MKKYYFDRFCMVIGCIALVDICRMICQTISYKKQCSSIIDLQKIQNAEPEVKDPEPSTEPEEEKE